MRLLLVFYLFCIAPADCTNDCCLTSGKTSWKLPGERQLVALRNKVGLSDGVQQTRHAIFATGCFWGVELAVARLPGVLHTDVGYTGGSTTSPTYATVSRGTTGHAEAVRVGYDPSLISYETLLGVFFDFHDTSRLFRQGNDVGSHRRSTIFYSTEEEHATAKAVAAAELKRTGQPYVVTTFEPQNMFYPAEDYHQQYLAKLGQSDVKGETAPIRCYV